MRVLLTGGAGFLGSHTAVALAAAGHQCLIVDDLSNSHPDVVVQIEALTGAKVPALFADLRQVDAVAAFLAENGPVDAVIHLAGLKAVGESVDQPVRYYDINLGTTVAVLRLMKQAAIGTIVFSSSAAVYGHSSEQPLTEATPTGSVLASPYARTKFFNEQLLQDAATADPTSRVVVLRYFNPVGAHPSGLIGEDPRGRPSNLLPLVCAVAAGQLDHVMIFGNDYPTPDGTGLRDYLHVQDLARAHVHAVERAQRGFEVYNLGTGVPNSVNEVIATFAEVTGTSIPAVVHPRRTGDVAVSYADPAKAADKLGWRAELTLADACRDAWNWQQLHPPRS